jgi:hypothetical protein
MVNLEYIKTQSDLADQYLTYVKSYNKDTNPDIDDSVFWIFAQVYAGILSGIYQELYLYSLNIFPQTASGVFIDKHLASWGLPPRSAGIYAVGTVSIVNSTTSSVTIPAKAQLTTGDGSKIYYVDALTIISANTTGTIPIRSSIANSGYYQTSGTNLMLPTPIGDISSATVIQLTDGSSSEDDLHAAARLLNSIQTPRLGGSKTDYYNWCLTADNSVTDAYFVQSSNAISGYILSGALNMDNLLSNPLSTYTRTPNSTILNNVSNYIESQRPFTDEVTILGAATYLITEKITVNVQLVSGYQIADSSTVPPTQSTFINSIGLTVNDLICREVRRAIVSASQNPQLISGTYFITKQSIEQQLDLSLSASSIAPGIYAQIIQNKQVVLDSASNVGLVVPSPLSSGQLCYDLTPNYVDLIIGELS